MLPVETFVEIASFLGYYDLGGLKLTNTLFSSVAKQCADAIRLFDFSGFFFIVLESRIDVYRPLYLNGTTACRGSVCWNSTT